GCGAPFVVPTPPVSEAAPEPLPMAFVEEAPPSPPPAPGRTARPADAFEFEPATRKPRPPSGSRLGDFLTFRLLITPLVIQIIFWIGVTFAILGALYLMFQGISIMTHPGGSMVGFIEVLVGLASLVLGPLWVRVSCELVIVQFRIHDTLTDIKGITGRL